MCHSAETRESSSLKGDNLLPKDMTLCNHLVPSPFPGLEHPSCEREVCVHFGVRCNFLGPRQIEALGGCAGGVWLRGFTLLLVPIHWVRELGVRDHQLQHLFTFLGAAERMRMVPRSHDALETSGAPDRTQDASGSQGASSRGRVR